MPIPLSPDGYFLDDDDDDDDQPESSDDEDEHSQFAVQHAPKGGGRGHGRQYKGGQFIPQDFSPSGSSDLPKRPGFKNVMEYRDRIHGLIQRRVLDAISVGIDDLESAQSGVGGELSEQEQYSAEIAISMLNGLKKQIGKINPTDAIVDSLHQGKNLNTGTFSFINSYEQARARAKMLDVDLPELSFSDIHAGLAEHLQKTDEGAYSAPKYDWLKASRANTTQDIALKHYGHKLLIEKAIDEHMQDRRENASPLEPFDDPTKIDYGHTDYFGQIFEDEYDKSGGRIDAYRNVFTNLATGKGEFSTTYFEQELAGHFKNHVSKKLAERLRGNEEFEKLVDASAMAGGHIKKSLLGSYMDTYNIIDEKPELSEEMRDKTRYAVCSNLIHKWASTSGDSNPDSIALQMAAEEEFNMEPHVRFRQKLSEGVTEDSHDIYHKFGPALRAFVRAQYDETQSILKEHEIDRMTLYRGATIPTEHLKESGLWRPEGIRQAAFNAKLQPMSSFSVDFRTAANFSLHGEIGSSKNAVMAASIPASRILSLPASGFGCMNEGEVVVLGGGDSPVWAMFGGGNEEDFEDMDEEDFLIEARESVKVPGQWKRKTEE